MNTSTALAHASHIASAVANPNALLGPCAPEAHIVQSWKRCLDNGLDPAKQPEAEVIPAADLAAARESYGGFIPFARSELENLYQQIAGSGFAILLTDSSGLILDQVGDPDLEKDFHKADLLPGSIWSEEREGTNGIGTCLKEDRAVTVHREDHFSANHIMMSCTASPIRDAHGKLFGVLDASTVHSNDSRSSQRHTMALVHMSAKLMEDFTFMQQFRDSWILRFHSRPEFVGLLSEAMIAVDENGMVLAANAIALNHLELNNRDELLGHSIDEFMNLNGALIMERARTQNQMVWPVHDLIHGRRFFAMLRGPETKFECRPGEVAIAAISPDEEQDLGLDSLAGSDPRMAYNVRCARRIMDKNVPLLVGGETGTGKEAFARAIHLASNRASKAFVAINCASIPESLIESELFGYKHGAFTGARREGMRGKILQSNGGTLFLDEIGDMPPQLQTRLLRVLEEREVLPLGSESTVKVDLHVLSASHQNLRELVSQKVFREDLYYRLNGMTLNLPPLRERDDKETLIRRALAMENGGANPVAISDEAFARLTAYDWPGNIRQLINVLRTALALADDGIIRVADLPAEVAHVHSEFGPGTDWAGAFAKPEPDNPLDNAERKALLSALESHLWNITNTANSLDMSRNTLYRKMKKHAITAPRNH